MERWPARCSHLDQVPRRVMARKIFVGSLPQNISEDELRHEFDAFGDVEEVFIKEPWHKQTG